MLYKMIFFFRMGIIISIPLSILGEPLKTPLIAISARVEKVGVSNKKEVFRGSPGVFAYD
jgi:hypothetical protein